jgi:AraC-like DNA-binding protein
VIPPVPPARHLLRARDYMDRHYAEPLDLDDIALRAHASKAHFVREFRATFGETPHQYLLTRRLERAKHLLHTTELSVTEVCLEVGLQSLGSFSSSFKRVVGVTPTQYRATAQAADLRARVPGCHVRAFTRPAGRATLEKTQTPTRD